jgi:hypothetical protein
MPQSPQSPSSADIAKKYGGIAVGEIAAKYGGKPVEDEPPPPAAPVQPQGRFASLRDAFIKAGVPVGGGVSVPAGELVSAAANVPKMAYENLPAVGGAIGGGIGAAGGTLFGMGVGGVPGALAGASIGGATGEALKQLGDRFFFNPSKAPATATEAAGRIGQQAVIQPAMEATGQVAGRVAKAVAPELMQQAVKPGLNYLLERTPKGVVKVVQTMLDEGITVTPSGVQKLQKLLTEAGQTIETKTANAAGSVFPEEVVDHALDATKRFASQVNRSQDLAAIKASADQFMRERLEDAGSATFPAKPLTVAEAQAMKTGTYRTVGDKAFKGELKGAEVEAQKGLASGLREQIERLVPGIKGDNQRWAALADALDATARRAGFKGNEDLGGIFYVAHNPAAFIMGAISKNSMVKSLLAKGLYDHAGRLAKVPPQLLRFAVAALASEPDSKEPQ